MSIEHALCPILGRGDKVVGTATRIGPCTYLTALHVFLEARDANQCVCLMDYRTLGDSTIVLKESSRRECELVWRPAASQAFEKSHEVCNANHQHLDIAIIREKVDPKHTQSQKCVRDARNRPPVVLGTASSAHGFIGDKYETAIGIFKDAITDGHILRAQSSTSPDIWSGICGGPLLEAGRVRGVISFVAANWSGSVVHAVALEPWFKDEEFKQHFRLPDDLETWIREREHSLLQAWRTVLDTDGTFRAAMLAETGCSDVDELLAWVKRARLSDLVEGLYNLNEIVDNSATRTTVLSVWFNYIALCHEAETAAGVERDRRSKVHWFSLADLPARSSLELIQAAAERRVPKPTLDAGGLYIGEHDLELPDIGSATADAWVEDLRREVAKRLTLPEQTADETLKAHLTERLWPDTFRPTPYLVVDTNDTQRDDWNEIRQKIIERMGPLLVFELGVSKSTIDGEVFAAMYLIDRHHQVGAIS